MIGASGFDWDEGNRSKCQKHGVSVDEIEGLFAGDVTIFEDEGLSAVERRLKAIGKAPSGRSVFVVFTLRQRGEDMMLRPISARYMHKKEVAYYEKETSRAENG